MRRGDDGFALVSTLWFMALLALVAVLVEGWISRALDRATVLQERVASDAALSGALDRFLFMLASGGASPRGLELVPAAGAGGGSPGGSPAQGNNLPPNTPYVALDGRPYRLGDVTLRLQDEGGLHDVNTAVQPTLNQLLESYGIGANDAARLIGALAAYEKKPANPRARTAPEPDYARAGLPPPRHARLVTPWELYRVAGWAQAEALWQAPSPLAEMATIGPVGGLDINTAPVKVLATATGMGEREAARLVAGRQLHPITDPRELPSTIRPSEDRPVQLTPGPIIRATLSAAGDPLDHIISIRMTPGAAAPYRIDYAVDLPQSAAPDGLPPPAPLPQLPPAAPPH